ncbi:hypothetical protein EJB05_34769, partial [Eragrostis curvula]
MSVRRPRQIEATENVAPHPSKKPKKVENMTSNVAPPPKKVKKAEKKTEEESFPNALARRRTAPQRGPAISPCLEPLHRASPHHYVALARTLPLTEPLRLPCLSSLEPIRLTSQARSCQIWQRLPRI